MKNILINGKSSHIVINGYLGFFEHKYWIPFPNNLVSNSVSKIMPCIQNGTSFRQNATWENKKSDDIWLMTDEYVAWVLEWIWLKHGLFFLIYLSEATSRFKTCSSTL